MTKSQKLMQEFRDVAEQLLSEDEFGSFVILRKLDDRNDFNRRTMKAERSYTEYEGNAVKKNYTAEQMGELANIIKAGDVEFVIWLKDETVVPIEGKDKILFGGVEYNIIKVVEVDPNGGKKICHRCYSRRVQ